MRRSVSKLIATCCLACCLPLAGFAQTDSPEALIARAAGVYQDKDYSTFLILEKHILLLTPGDPHAIYNLARAEALMDHAAEAVAQLDKLLQLHLDFNAEKDSDFAGILKTPQWSQYRDHVAALQKPVVASTVAFTLSEKGLVAGGLAVDDAHGDTFIGSLRERKILKRTKDGVVSDFATEKDGLLAVSSLLVDASRRQLFASMSAIPLMQNYRKEDAGKAGICVFDLTTGKLIRSALISVPGEHHVLGQMAQDKYGTVFVLDTGSSEILRLKRASSELDLFLSSTVFQSPRGLALSADGRSLYVFDLATGLWLVDSLSIDRTEVLVPPEFSLSGLSGLVRVAGGLLSVQAGVQPNRLIRIRLNAKGDRVTAVDTLESNHPAYQAPVIGTLAGGDFFYIANSQLDALDSKTGLVAAGRAKETTILRLPVF